MIAVNNMNSAEIQADIVSMVSNQNYTAPYGVLTGSHCSKNGRKYLSVTFGRARTLDATVEIYNRNFMILRTSRHGSMVFKDYTALKTALQKL